MHALSAISELLVPDVQALQCTGACVSAIRKAGLHRYLDFLPVTSAYVYNQASTSLHRVPMGTAAVHADDELTAEARRKLWLLMREVERSATGAKTQLFSTEHFEAALAAFELPQYVQARML